MIGMNATTRPATTLPTLRRRERIIDVLLADTNAMSGFAQLRRPETVGYASKTGAQDTAISLPPVFSPESNATLWAIAVPLRAPPGGPRAGRVKGSHSKNPAEMHVIFPPRRSHLRRRQKKVEPRPD